MVKGGIGMSDNRGLAAQDGSPVRLIAFHLPQFHPIPANDRWWGRGFTEWTNVTRARPLFRGHDQPRLPADLGFYDLRLPEARAGQAELARAYGIEGFCYWHYWFHGQRLLERPVDDILASGEPNFPFCLAWANESWCRTWLGLDREILVKQTYSDQDDRNHARWLARAFADPRYIRIHGRPVLVVYKPKALPNSLRTTHLIREECLRQGLPNPYLVGIDAHCSGTDMRTLGFDMTEHHEPQLGALGADVLEDRPTFSKFQRNLRLGIPHAGYKIYSYAEATRKMATMRPSFPHFPCCFVGWDNTARRGKNAIVMVDGCPQLFEEQLSQMVTGVLHKHPQERIVFINAWNEWAEGMCLEPDQKHGHAYLHAVQRVVENARSTPERLDTGGRPTLEPELEPMRASSMRVHRPTASPLGVPQLVRRPRRNDDRAASARQADDGDQKNQEPSTDLPVSERNWADLYTLSADHDLDQDSFRQFDILEAAHHLLIQENLALKAQLANMGSSRAFKLACKLSRATACLVPPGSRRRRLAKYGYQGLKSLSTAGRQVHQKVTQRSAGNNLPQLDQAEPIRQSQRPRQGHGGSILVVDHAVPRLHHDSGSVRMLKLLELLGERGHHVTFFPDHPAMSKAQSQTMDELGVEVLQPPDACDLRAFLKEFGSEYSLIILSHADIATRHFHAVRHYAPQAKVVFDTVDLHYLHEERQANLEMDAEQTQRSQTRKRQELALVRHTDLTLVVSPVEKATLESELPGCNVEILTNIHEISPDRSHYDADRADLVFIGGFDHPPNVDAVLYFVSQILPRIQAKIPGIVFHVIGSNTPTSILELAGPHVRVHGQVPNVDPVFERCRLSIAPLRYGAGVKGKVNQSMALGVPVVATSIAAEGMHLTHEHDILIADDPEAFANAVVRLWSDPILWKKLVEHGYENIQVHFSVQAARAKVEALLDWAGLKTAANQDQPKAFARSSDPVEV